MKQEEIERFQYWMQEELNERNLTPNRLAKKAGISTYWKGLTRWQNRKRRTKKIAKRRKYHQN